MKISINSQITVFTASLFFSSQAEVELQWAMKAYHHAETYNNVRIHFIFKHFRENTCTIRPSLRTGPSCSKHVSLMSLLRGQLVKCFTTL